MATNPQRKHLTFSIRDFYKDYTKIVKKENFPKRDYITYRDYIFDVFAEIFKLILFDSWHFVLPFSSGEFYLKNTTSTTGSRVFCKTQTMKTGKPVYIFNNHRLRQTFRFVWDKSAASFPNAKFYKFNLITGEDKLHKKYKVGRSAINDFHNEVGNNPRLKIPVTYDNAIKTLIEPDYGISQQQNRIC